MAVAEEQEVIIVAGSSNIAAYKSRLYELPLAEYVRWFTKPPPTATTPNRPILDKLSNNRILTPRRPFANVTQRGIDMGTPPTSTSFKYLGSSIAAVVADTWCVLRTVAVVGPVTITQASPAVFTQTKHGMIAGTSFTLNTTGALLTGLAAGVTYYVLPTSLTVDSYRASLTPGGPAINTTGTQSGTHTTTPTGTTAHTYVRRVASVAGQVVTFDPALPDGAVTTADSGATFLLESHTISSIDTIGGIPRKGFTKTGSPAAFDANVADKWVVVFNGATGQGADTPPSPNLNEVRRIKTRVSGTAVEFYDAFFHDTTHPERTPEVGDGFVVLMGANAVHSIAEITQPNCVLQEIQFAFGDEPCFYTGLDYTNWDQTPFASPRAFNFDPTCSSLTELAWQFGAYFSKPLVFIEMGISSSMISPFPFPDLTPRHDFSWGWDLRSLDFDPTISSGIYDALINYIDVTRALLAAEGKTMKVVGIFMNIADNDPGDLQRLMRLGESITQFRDSIRTYLGDQKIPFVMSGPSAYGFNYRPFIYAQLRQLAKNDGYTGLVDTRWPTYTYADDGLHFSVAGQLQLAQHFFGCWKATKARGDRLAA